MKRMAIRLFLGLTVAGLLFSTTSWSHAKEAGKQENVQLQKLLKAVEANDYEGLLANADDNMKTNMTTKELKVANVKFSSHLKKGYECIYLGTLQKENGFNLYLWKIKYKDGYADTLAKLFLKNGLVAGFVLE